MSYISLPETQSGSHFVQRYGEIISLHLSCKNVLKIIVNAPFLVNRNGEVPSWIICWFEKRKSLDMIPVCMGQSNENIIILFDGASNKIKPKLSYSGACVKNSKSSIFESDQDASSIAPELDIVRFGHGY
jgi:hypothetical protein